MKPIKFNRDLQNTKKKIKPLKKKYHGTGNRKKKY